MQSFTTSGDSLVNKHGHVQTVYLVRLYGITGLSYRGFPNQTDRLLKANHLGIAAVGKLQSKLSIWFGTGWKITFDVHQVLALFSGFQGSCVSCKTLQSCHFSLEHVKK